MKKEQLLININARIDEIEGYQTNITNYERVIQKINKEWCEQSLKYKHMENADVAPLVSDSWLLEKVNDLNFKEKLQVALRIERMEQRKVKLLLEVLNDQLDEITEGEQ